MKNLIGEVFGEQEDTLLWHRTFGSSYDVPPKTQAAVITTWSSQADKERRQPAITWQIIEEGRIEAVTAQDRHHCALLRASPVQGRIESQDVYHRSPDGG